MAEADLRENAITLLSSKTEIDMKTAATQRILYTVPTGKSAVITHVVVRNPSLSLAGGTSYAFGNNSATYDNWASAVSLASMTTTSTDVTVLISTKPSDSVHKKVTLCATGTQFSMYITTGSTAAATATVDIFGYLL